MQKVVPICSETYYSPPLLLYRSNYDKIELIFTDLTTSNAKISGNNNLEEILRNYLTQESKNKCLLRDYLFRAGAIITEDKNNADIDLSINNLNKSSLVEILK